MIYSGQEREVPALVNVARTVEEMAELLKVSISKHATLHTDLAKDQVHDNRQCPGFPKSLTSAIWGGQQGWSRVSVGNPLKC